MELAVRTNIEIDDQLIEEAQQLTGLKTKREVVDAALRMLIRIEKANILISRARCTGKEISMRAAKADLGRDRS